MRPLNYHDDAAYAALVTNSAFYLDGVTAGRPTATSIIQT